MLIEFTIENFRSFKTEQTLSLVASKGKEFLFENTFPLKEKDDIRLLNVAAIYGPNAGGKSNFLNALRIMKHLVVNSAQSLQHGNNLPITPFLLGDEELNLNPTLFEVIFIEDGIRYQYGFTATKDRIYSEQLLAYPKNRPQKWFERLWNPKTENYDWHFSTMLHGEKSIWQNSTRENALFLSTGVLLNSKQLQPVFNWFNQKLKYLYTISRSPELTAKMAENTSAKDKIVNFLKAADLGIEDLEIIKEKFDSSRLPRDMPEKLKEFFVESNAKFNKSFYNIKTVHKSLSGTLVKFDLEEESNGTRKIFCLAGRWIDALENGHVLFIDELHNSLHPKLVDFLIKLFHDKKTNTKNAQLIFTTHETSILSKNELRRDQIWFCQKDKNQATELYPLTDFSPRKLRENIESSYLSGRYGAVPFVSIFK